MKKMLSGLFVILPIFMGVIAMDVKTVEAQEQITWRLPAHYPEASPSFRDSVQAVADKVKERTDGNFILDTYAAGTIIPGPDTFTSVRRGVVEIGVTSSAYDLDEVPIFNVVAGLPFPFASEWEGVYFHKWLGFEEMVQDILLENHGLLYFTDRIYTTELSSQVPIESMADFEGLNIRSSGILQKYLTSIGAAASFLPGGDIYTSLASGMMDAAHWGAVQGSSRMGFHEINKYHLSTPLSVAATDIWVVNKEAFDKLPEEYQEVLLDTMEEHFWMRTNQYQYQEALERALVVEKHGVTFTTLPDDEYAKMQEAAIEIWDEVAEKSPECAKAIEMIKDFNREMGRIE